MVYFIECHLGHIKIGHDGEGDEGDPWRRLTELQTGNPCPLTLLAVMFGGKREEQQVHRMFRCAQIRMEGRATEWFRRSRELVDYIVRHGTFHDEDKLLQRSKCKPKYEQKRLKRRCRLARRTLAAREKLMREWESRLLFR
jgi:hypothetical protein